jgi:signal transduction histidine kinase
LWAALRSGQAVTALAALILSGFAVWGVATGRGPFIQPNLNDSFLLVIAFIVSTTLPSLALSAAVTSRDALLERAYEELYQAQKLEAIGQLTGGVAHDFNNLLTVISSGIRMLDRPAGSERRALIINSMHQAIDRGASLTRQLLAFARRETLHPEIIDLADCIAGMKDLLQRTLGANIRVKLSVPPDLWPVEVDPGRLEMVILNLAVNSRDAMPDGGELVIRAENIPADKGHALGFVSISVTDSGLGMSAEVRGRAFEPFYKKGQGAARGLVSVRFLVSSRNQGVLRRSPAS